MHILVTGATGQLGSEIKLLAPKYPMYHFTYIDIEECNLSSEDAIHNYFSNNHFDTIINCAAYTAVDKAEEDVKLVDAINHLAAKHIAKAAALQGAHLIHISTDYVFDGTNHRPYKESDPCAPLGIYGSTKLKGEEAVLRTLSSCATIIRTSWLYSAYGHNFLKSMMKLGTEKDNLRIVNDQIGTPTYARDLARCILDICPNLTERPSEIYHFSNEGVCSWYDFSKAIMECAKLECQVDPIPGDSYPTPAKRPYYSVLSKEKIKDTFHITIPYWKDSVRDCIQYINERLHVHA